MHEEAHGIFMFSYSVSLDTSNLPLILHVGSECLFGRRLLVSWWGAAALGSRRAVAPLRHLALGSPAVDACMPGRGLAGSDPATLGRRWPSAGMDK